MYRSYYNPRYLPTVAINKPQFPYISYFYSHAKQCSASSEANLFFASREILEILWKPEDHRIPSAHHLSLSRAISIQSIPPTFHFLKVHSNINLPSTP